jgi:RNA polymerase sigma-70 factor (ECF subfamily)
MVKPQPSASTIEELLEAARVGSEQELGSLLEVFEPELKRLADDEIGEQLQRRMSTSDLVQETLLTANQKFSGFRGTSAQEFRRWLLDVFHSRLVDGIRRHRIAECRTVTKEEPGRHCSQPDPTDSPSAVTSMHEEAGRLMLALDSLPAPLQDVVRMRYMNDMTFEAISESTGVSVATVWRRWEEAVLRLRSRLQDS